MTSGARSVRVGGRIGLALGMRGLRFAVSLYSIGIPQGEECTPTYKPKTCTARDITYVSMHILTLAQRAIGQFTQSSLICACR